MSQDLRKLLTSRHLRWSRDRIPGGTADRQDHRGLTSSIQTSSASRAKRLDSRNLRADDVAPHALVLTPGLGYIVEHHSKRSATSLLHSESRLP